MKKKNEQVEFIKNEMAVEMQQLIRTDNIFESLRFAEYSFESSLGEIVDNAVEAKASSINIVVDTEKKKFLKKEIEVISEVAVIDNGIGMSQEVQHKCLALGESCRQLSIDGKRGIGRFGVGLTLGGISIARHIDVYTRTNADDEFSYTYIDLDEISDQRQKYINKPILKCPPEKYAKLLLNSVGTIIILSKCDRLQCDVNNADKGVAASMHIAGLATYLGRTYRKFIYGGLNIFLNSQKVYLHDPLYVMGPTKFDKKGDTDEKAEQRGNEIKIPLTSSITGKKEEIRIRISLLPKNWRKKQGDGKSDFAKERKIVDNEGISILRADREVLYAKVPFIFGIKGLSRYEPKDRFWGCEISFPPELDEYFQVRYIKRGAEPTPALRDLIREKIAPTIKSCRDEITAYWMQEKGKKAQEQGHFANAEELMQKANSTIPSARIKDQSEEEINIKLNEIVNQSIISGKTEEEIERLKVERLLELKEKPYTIQPVRYPQTNFFETVHLLDKVIILLNINHPFYKKIFEPLCGSIIDGEEDTARTLEQQKNRDAMLLLLLSYAKAETFFENQGILLENLRSQWGTILATVISQMED